MSSSSSSSSPTSDLQRRWIDARCAPPTAAQRRDKVVAFLSIFVSTFTSRTACTFRALFGDGLALVEYLCQEFVSLTLPLTLEKAASVPTLSALTTVQLLSQALCLLLSADGLSNTDVGRLASSFESVGNHKVVTLSLQLHDRLLTLFQVREGSVNDWAALSLADASLLKLIATVLACHRKELIRRPLLEAVYPERIRSVAATASAYFLFPETAGAEASEVSCTVLHQLLPNALSADTTWETLQHMEKTLLSLHRNSAAATEAMLSLSCFACLVENIMYAKQLLGFATTESLNFDVIIATLLQFEKEVGDEGLPHFRRVVEFLRVLALAERPEVASPATSSVSSFGATFFRLLPRSVGKVPRRIVETWGGGDQRATAAGIHCDAAVDALARLFVLTPQGGLATLCGCQLFELLSMKGVSSTLLRFVLCVCAESAPRFEVEKLGALFVFVSTLPSRSEVGDFLRCVLDHLRRCRFHLPEQRLAVVDFFISWCPKASAHTAVAGALGVVQACVHCMTPLMTDPCAGDLERFAERFSIVSKVVMSSRDAEEALCRDNCGAALLQVMLSSVANGEAHTAVLLRDTFAGLALKAYPLCDTLLASIATATSEQEWSAEATPLLSTLVLLLHRWGRQRRSSLPHHSIELCLSLTEQMEECSLHPAVDRLLLGCCLSLLLSLVNHSDVWELVERTLGSLPITRHHVQYLLDLCTGVLHSVESLAMADILFTQPKEGDEQREGPRFLQFGAFTVLAEPALDLLYLVKLLLRIVDVMLSNHHADASDAVDAMEYVLLHAGVTVPNEYVVDFIVRWERFTCIRCVSNFCDPKLLPLFLASASDPLALQRCQQVWLDALAANSDGENSVCDPGFIHFGDGGGVGGSITCSGDMWPPLDAYTAALWCCMDASSFSGRQEGGVMLWRLEWSAAGRPFSLSLVAHTQRKCCQFTCGIGSDVKVVELPALPERRWVHIVVTHTRGKVFASQVKLFFDGVEVARSGCPYPAGGLQTAASLATVLPTLKNREVCVTIGCPRNTLSTHATLRFVGFQLYGGGASLHQVASLYAMGPRTTGQVWDPSGRQFHDVRSAFLCDDVVRALEASTGSGLLASVLQDGCVELVHPPPLMLADIHVSAMRQISTPSGFLNSKTWVLCSLASLPSSTFELHGSFRLSRDSHSRVKETLLSSGALHEWMRWMQCIAQSMRNVDEENPEHVSAVMEQAQQMTYKMLRVTRLFQSQAALLPRGWHRFMAQLGQHVTRYPSVYLHHPTTVAELLRTCVRTACFRDEQGCRVEGPLLTSLSPLEHILFNWRLLTGVPECVWLKVITTLQQLVAPFNPLAGINSTRLLAADFVNGFVLGLLREYVVLPRLVAAVELIKSVVLAGQSTEWLMEQLLTAVLLTIRGPCPSSSTLESHLGSKLAATSDAYLVLARNLLLRCLNDLLEMSVREGKLVFLDAFVAVVPDWWFSALLSAQAHPVSATLSLRLFALCFLHSRSFREEYTAYKLECLASAMESHCYQRELMEVLVHAYMGHLWVVSSSHADYCDIECSGQNEREGLLVMILELLRSQCRWLLRGSPSISDGIKVRSYFSAAADSAITPSNVGGSAAAVRRWRRLRLMIRVSHQLQSRGSVKTMKGQDSAARTVTVEEHAAVTLALRESVREVLDWLTHTLRRSSTLGRSLYGSGNAANLVDLLAWPVLLAIRAAELVDAPARPYAGSFGSPSVGGDTLGQSNASSSSSSAEEGEGGGWEVLPEDASGETRSFGMDLVGAGEGMGDIYAACLNFFLVHAGSRATSAGLLVTGQGGQRKMNKFILALHRALSYEVAGVQPTSEDARKSFLCGVWIKAMEHAIASTIDSGASAVRRNATELCKYLLDRLVSGNAVPPCAVASYIRFLLHHFTGDAHVVKTSRTALFEWFMYVTSVSFHKLDPVKVGVVVEMIQDCTDTLLVFPMPATEMLRVVVGRLLQLTVCIVSDMSDSGHRAVQKLALLWKAVLTANLHNPSLASFFACSSSSVDAFRDGFQLLLTPRPSMEAFVTWLQLNRTELGVLIRSYAGVSYTFVMANAVEYAQLIRKYTVTSASEVNRRRGHVAALVASHWQLWKETLMTTSFVDSGLLSCNESRYNNCYVLSSAQPARVAEEGVCSEWLLGGQGAVGRGSRYTSESVDEVASDPIGYYIRYAPPLCLPLRPRRTAGSEVTLQANAWAILAKVVGRGVAGSLQFISNAYYVLGSESYICTVLLTQLELVIITCSAVTPAGDFFVEQVRVHAATQQTRVKSSFLLQTFRRLLTGQDKGGGSSTSSTEAFCYSQYYRQLQTEAAKGSNALVWRFPLMSIVCVHQRLFQHLSAGLEVVLDSGKGVFLVLLDNELSFSKASRDQLFACFNDDVENHVPAIATHAGSEKTAMLGVWTRRWVRRECSSYTYLRILNDAASRTVANLGQYPVMPWVLSGYSGHTLSLTDTTTYRDLSKPVGALNETKTKELRKRYDESISVGTAADSPYHYGTHYSTSAIVLYFLVRLQPFTTRSIRYQGGRLDVADRLFHSVAEAWSNSSGRSSGDVKELIPEFFRVSEFLRNRNSVCLGTRGDGTELGDVVLPPWCSKSAERFVYMNALSLESEVVSAQLHHWVDLIFGCNQVGQGAVEALNVFSPLSYKEGVDRAISRAATEEQRRAIVASADNFGQTPLQLFPKNPHPARMDAADAATTQRYMIDTVKDVATRRCFSAQVVGDPHSSLTAMFLSNDALYVFGSLTAVGASRPLQCFRYDDCSDRLLCTTVSGERVIATIGQLQSIGGGSVRCMCVTSRGGMVCLGTTSGRVIVYGRLSFRDRFYLVAVMDATADPSFAGAGGVSSLFLFDEGVLLAAYEKTSAVSGWHISLASSTFSFATSCATPADSTAIHSISQDIHTGVFYASKAMSIVCFAASGTVLAQFPIDAILPPAPHDCAAGLGSACITAMLLVNCPSFSFTNVVLLGHSNGAVSLWSVNASQNMSDTPDSTEAALWTFQFLHRVDFEAAITCLAASPEDATFVVALADSTVHELYFPSAEIDNS